MTRIALVSCCKPKLAHAAPAHELYTSPLFKLSLAHALKRFERAHVYVISAEYELLDIDHVVEPYDRVLHDFGKERIAIWGRRVWSSIEHRYRAPREVHFYAGSEYVKPIRRAAHRCPAIDTFVEPLANKQIGQRLQWLRAELGAAS